jgi:predicted glutamine amidotransferase
MCRLFALAGVPHTDAGQALHEFQKLAHSGCTPAGTPKGHKDGWGITAYNSQKVFLAERHTDDAATSSAFSKAATTISERERLGIVVGHLRKAAVGGPAIPNTHPFTKSTYTLCHNGVIMHGEKLPLSPAYRKLVKGETDTEKFFYYIVQMTAGTRTAQAARRALMKAIRFVKENLDYTAMNVLFSNGRYLWAVRDVNEKNTWVKEHKALDYYSLYEGHNGSAVYVSSEQLPVHGVKWRKIMNQTLLEFDTKTGKTSLVSL